MNEHSPRTLDKRFDEEGGDLVRLFCERLFQRSEASVITDRLCIAEAASVGMRGGDGHVVTEEWTVDLVKKVDAPDTDSANGVAVVAVGEVKEFLLVGTGVVALLPILERHLQGDLDGRCATVGIEDVVESVGRDIYYFFCELDGRDVRRAQQSGVSDAVELVANGRIDFRDPVAVDIAPYRCVAVEVSLALDIVEVGAFGAFDDDGVVGGVVLHLSERVPEMLLVDFGQMLFLRVVHEANLYE